MTPKDKAIDRAAEHIRRQCPPSDVAGRMVLAAFAMDSINHEYGEDEEESEC